jgi:hypothetical protein
MGTLGIVILLLVGFFVIRFLMRARSMTNTANSVVATGQKISIIIQMARQKAGRLVETGPMTDDKQFYIGYLDAAAEEQARADGQPLTIFRALVAQEAANISNLPESESSMALYDACLASEAGTEGKRLGRIDGEKLADRSSSQPYFIEFETWLASRQRVP